MPFIPELIGKIRNEEFIMPVIKKFKAVAVFCEWQNGAIATHYFDVYKDVKIFYSPRKVLVLEGYHMGRIVKIVSRDFNGYTFHEMPKTLTARMIQSTEKLYYIEK